MYSVQLWLLMLLVTLVKAQNCTDANRSTALTTTQPYVLFRRCTVRSSSTIVVKTGVTRTATFEYSRFQGDSYLHVNGSTLPSTTRITIEVIHNSFFQAGVVFSGTFSNANLTFRNNTLLITRRIDLGQLAMVVLLVFLDDVTLMNTTTFLLYSNNMTSTSSVGQGNAASIYVNSAFRLFYGSYFCICYNNMTVTSTDNDVVAMSFENITIISSYWSISYNNVVVLVNNVNIGTNTASNVYFTNTSMTSSSWIFACNNMTSSPTNIGYTLYFGNTTMNTSSCSLSYNTMKSFSAGAANVFFNGVHVTSSNWSVMYNSMDGENSAKALSFSNTTMNSSNCIISHNNMTATTVNVVFYNGVIVNFSNWSITHNNMTSTSGSIIMNSYGPVTMTSSNWSISYNNMTSGVDVLSLYSSCLGFSDINVTSSRCAISFNKMIARFISFTVPSATVYFSNLVMTTTIWTISHNYISATITITFGPANAYTLSFGSITISSSTWSISYNNLVAAGAGNAAGNLYFSNVINISSSNWSITHNIMVASGSTGSHILHLLHSIFIASSTWTISDNKMTASASGSSYVLAMYKTTVTTSNWSICNNKMTASSGSIGYTVLLYFINISASTWYITYNNMTATGSSAYAFYLTSTNVTMSHCYISYNELRAVAGLGSAFIMRFTAVFMYQSNWSQCSDRTAAKSNSSAKVFHFNSALGLYNNSHFDVMLLTAELNSLRETMFIRFHGGLTVSDTGRFSLLHCLVSGSQFNATSSALVSGAVNISATGIIAMFANTWYGSLLATPYNSTIVSFNVSAYLVHRSWVLPCLPTYTTTFSNTRTILRSHPSDSATATRTCTVSVSYSRRTTSLSHSLHTASRSTETYTSSHSTQSNSLSRSAKTNILSLTESHSSSHSANTNSHSHSSSHTTESTSHSHTANSHSSQRSESSSVGVGSVSSTASSATGTVSKCIGSLPCATMMMPVTQSVPCGAGFVTAPESASLQLLLSFNVSVLFRDDWAVVVRGARVHRHRQR